MQSHRANAWTSPSRRARGLRRSWGPERDLSKPEDQYEKLEELTGSNVSTDFWGAVRGEATSGSRGSEAEALRS